MMLADAFISETMPVQSETLMVAIDPDTPETYLLRWEGTIERALMFHYLSEKMSSKAVTIRDEVIRCPKEFVDRGGLSRFKVHRYFESFGWTLEETQSAYAEILNFIRRMNQSTTADF